MQTVNKNMSENIIFLVIFLIITFIYGGVIFTEAGLSDVSYKISFYIGNLLGILITFRLKERFWIKWKLLSYSQRRAQYAVLLRPTKTQQVIKRSIIAHLN